MGKVRVVHSGGRDITNPSGGTSWVGVLPNHQTLKLGDPMPTAGRPATVRGLTGTQSGMWEFCPWRPSGRSHSHQELLGSPPLCSWETELSGEMACLRGRCCQGPEKRLSALCCPGLPATCIMLGCSRWGYYYCSYRRCCFWLDLVQGQGSWYLETTGDKSRSERDIFLTLGHQG